MRYANLSLSTQVILIFLLAAAATMLLTRSLIFLLRERSGIQPIYPNSWSALQRRTLEIFRLMVGCALILLWGFYLFTTPSLPTNAPFGYFEAVLLILLLLFSHAWVFLLAPQSCPTRFAFSSSFWVTMTVLAVWWLSALAATGWIIVKASTPPARVIPLNGAFASLHPPRLDLPLVSISATAAVESSSIRRGAKSY
jgi:hypothetical protein